MKCFANFIERKCIVAGVQICCPSTYTSTVCCFCNLRFLLLRSLETFIETIVKIVLTGLFRISSTSFFINFIAREWKEKYDTVDNVEEDTLTFTLRNTWIFRPDLSALTGEEIVTIPHPLIMGVLLMVQRDREAMMPLVKKGVNILFDPLESAFLKVRIMDLLFDGIYVDCSSQDFAAKALCSGMDSEGAVMPHNETHYKFSFFGMVSKRSVMHTTTRLYDLVCTPIGSAITPRQAVGSCTGA